MNVPNGENEIIVTFGNIYKYILDDGTLSHDWQSQYLGIAVLPFPLTLSWAPLQVSKVTCHKLLIPEVEGVFQKVKDNGLQDKITTFGGCFNYRPQRSSHKLSTHSWGIALDLNPEQNEQGTDGNMNQDVIHIFESAGFYWGGNFHGKRKDPMHFQFATGY